MALKKLTDKDKVQSAKAIALKALNSVRFNDGKIPSAVALVGSLAQIYAVLESTANDGRAIDFLSFQIEMEVFSRQAKPVLPGNDYSQLALPEIKNEPTEESKNPTGKTRK